MNSESDIVLITGASSGIGRAIARSLSQENYRLILCGRNAERLEETAAYCRSHTLVHTLCFDVSDKDEVQKQFEQLPEEWKSISVLINNAGNAHGLDPVYDADTKDWDAMIDSNIKGLLYISAHCMPVMKAKGRGHIINISSVAARMVYPGGTVYCATKKAVDTITDGMRTELTAFGIKVSSVQPGAVETAFSSVRFKNDKVRAEAVYQGYEALRAEDIADAVRYILSVPERVNIAEMCIYPKAQADPKTIYRNL